MRLDLNPEDICHWEETIKSVSLKCNLLLACENDKCELEATRLTWVAGSTIRPFFANNQKAAQELLQSLGVNSAEAQLVKEHCPGLGREITWAFYLERHGWLSASPVIDNKFDLNQS